MGDVGSIYIGTTVYALSEVDQTEGEALCETETDGVRFTFEEEAEFSEFTDEDITMMVRDALEIFEEHLVDSLLALRDALQEGAELAVVYDMYENQEPDWEV